MVLGVEEDAQERQRLILQHVLPIEVLVQLQGHVQKCKRFLGLLQYERQLSQVLYGEDHWWIGKRLLQKDLVLGVLHYVILFEIFFGHFVGGVVEELVKE